MGQQLLGNILPWCTHVNCKVNSLAIAKIHNLNSKAINFVLAFPQADMEEDIWMDLLNGFQVDGQTEEDSN
eukprot:14090157-Ditylum_brightwellii.AAC.1